MTHVLYKSDFKKTAEADHWQDLLDALQGAGFDVPVDADGMEIKISAAEVWS